MSGEKQMSHQTVTNKFRAGLGEPTNEASAEEKFILIMPCKEEEDEVNAYLLTIALPWWRCKAHHDILIQTTKKIL